MNVPSQPLAQTEASTAVRTQNGAATRLLQRRAGFVAAGAIVAMTSSASPTGERLSDLVWLAALGATLTLAGQSARRLVLVVSCAVVATAAVGEPISVTVAGLALALAYASTRSRLRRNWLSGLSGIGLVYALLHLPVERHPAASAVWFLAATVPVCASAYRYASRPHRRAVRRLAAGLCVCSAVLSIALATTALRGRHLVANGRSAVEEATSLVTTDTDGAATELGRAQRHFTSASTAFSTPWLLPVRMLPGGAQHLRVLRVAADQSTLVTAQTGDLLASYASTQATLSNQTAFDLNAIETIDAPLSDLHLTLQGATKALTKADSPWLLPQLAGPLDQATSQLLALEQSVSIASRAVGVAPDLLGEERPARWLIAVTNPSESRFHGGFLASYLLLEIDRGNLAVRASGSTGELVAAPGDQERTLTAPSEFIARYATRYQPARYFQNLTASPDSASNAAAITELFPQTGGGQLDGVVFMDPFAVQALVGLLGAPLSLPQSSTLLDGSNTADHLLRQQYLVGDPADINTRRDQLDAIALEAVAQLVENRPPLIDLAKVVQHGVETGHLSVHPVDQRAAEVFIEAGLAGQRPDPPSADGADDVLSVRTANAGRNKLDMFLERQIDYETDVDGGDVNSSLTLRLHNGAPTDGLPLYVMGSDGKRSAELGRNTQYVSIYSPFDLVSSSVDGESATFEYGTEGGLNTYSRLVDIGPMESISIELHFEGRRIAGRERQPYRLDIWQQPTVNPDLIRTTVSSGNSSWRPRTERSAVIQRDQSLIRSAADSPLHTSIVFERHVP